MAGALGAATLPCAATGSSTALGWPGAWDPQGRQPGTQESSGWQGGEEEMCLVRLLGSQDLQGMRT